MRWNQRGKPVRLGEGVIALAILFLVFAGAMMVKQGVRLVELHRLYSGGVASWVQAIQAYQGKTGQPLVCATPAACRGFLAAAGLVATEEGAVALQVGYTASDGSPGILTLASVALGETAHSSLVTLADSHPQEGLRAVQSQVGGVIDHDQQATMVFTLAHISPASQPRP